MTTSDRRERADGHLIARVGKTGRTARLRANTLWLSW